MAKGCGKFGCLVVILLIAAAVVWLVRSGRLSEDDLRSVNLPTIGDMKKLPGQEAAGNDLKPGRRFRLTKPLQVEMLGEAQLKKGPREVGAGSVVTILAQDVAGEGAGSRGRLHILVTSSGGRELGEAWVERNALRQQTLKRVGLGSNSAESDKPSQPRTMTLFGLLGEDDSGALTLTVRAPTDKPNKYKSVTYVLENDATARELLVAAGGETVTVVLIGAVDDAMKPPSIVVKSVRLHEK